MENAIKPCYVGNAIKSGFFAEHCYNLVYLELAACRLTALPEELAMLVPNLRVLNLNYNFLEDIRALEGLTRLRKLSIIGSRVQGTRALIRVVQRMPEAEMLDFRQVWRLCGDSCRLTGVQNESMHAWLVSSAVGERFGRCTISVRGTGAVARTG